jgi:murein L,D-transpeptidase YafK
LSRKRRDFILGSVTTLRRSLPVLLCAAVLAGCFAAERPPAPPPPVAAVVEPPVQPERWIRVRKTERILTVYEGTQPVKTYAVVLGKDPVWAKLYEGDQRTPEGEYHITRKYFHPFWSRFMLLDYPTARNRELYAWSRAKRLLPERGRRVPGIGGAIGIHGTEDERLNRRGVNWTAGCVSLFNRDVDELYDLVEVGTRVVIER